jgi:type I restriction enzyme R subunit
MKKLGLDIVPHRQRMNDSQPALDEKFKDPQDPLRIVFLCAMWLTGFDAPSCSTVYLDKPMRNHSLMQTIARANRVFPEKHSGLIVDYANVFASLEKALAIYGQGTGGGRPVRNIQELANQLKQGLEVTEQFCRTHGVELATIEKGSGMEPLNNLAKAVDRLIAPDPIRKEFLAHERLVSILYKALLPDLGAIEYSPRVTLLNVLASEIKLRTGESPADIREVMAELNALLDKSVAAEGFRIENVDEDKPESGQGVVDLSQIDFAALRQRFKASSFKNIELERLKAAVRAKLEKLILLNRTRTDFLEKYTTLIEEYNQGSRNVEEMLEQLIALSHELTEEEARHVRENLSEEELAIFDVLTRPGPKLSEAERDEVKKVARGLLDRLQALLVLDWRKRPGSLAKVKIEIQDALDTGLPSSYSPELYNQKCGAVFEHVFEQMRQTG